MTEQPPPYDDGYTPPADPARAVGVAVQRTAAASLGRGFLPLMALALAGLVQGMRGGWLEADVLVLVIGSVLAAGAMLAYGQLAVHRVLGRPKKPWMVAASVGGFFPYVYGLYVIAWLGLAPLRDGLGLGTVAAAVFFVGMGAWCLRSHWRLTDLHLFTREVVDLVAPEGGEDVISG